MTKAEGPCWRPTMVAVEHSKKTADDLADDIRKNGNHERARVFVRWVRAGGTSMRVFAVVAYAKRPAHDWYDRPYGQKCRTCSAWRDESALVTAPKAVAS